MTIEYYTMLISGYPNALQMCGHWQVLDDRQPRTNLHSLRVD